MQFHSAKEKATLIQLARKSVSVDVISDRIMTPISDHIDTLHLPYFGGKENMKDDWKKSLELAYRLGQISQGKPVKSINGIELKKDKE